MPDFTEFTDEELMAYADGELPPETGARLALALTKDPVLQQRLARYTQTRAVLRSAFASIVDAPMPARLQSLFDRRVEPPLAPAPPATPRRLRRRATPWAMAASLLLAIGLAALLLPRATRQDTVIAHRGLQPDAALLGRTLEMQASGEPLSATIGTHSEEIMPVSTLRTADGRDCRLFDARFEQAPDASRHAQGLACRQAQSRWQVLAVVDADAVTATQPSTDRYRTAGAGAPDLQHLLPNATMLTPQAEIARISEGWR